MEGDRELGRETWPEVADSARRVLLLPVGSCEQHGPHLPLDTDTRIATAVALGVARARRDTVVAPPVAYGSSGEHQSFAGTLSMGTEALTAVLVELGRSALSGSDAAPHLALVLVNGHGGNAEAVGRARDVLTGEGRLVSAWFPAVPGGDAHAGRTETSLLLAIAPHLVGPERPVGAVAPLTELMGRLRTGGVASVALEGVLGDATGASADEGHAILSGLVADLDRRVDEVSART